MKDSEKKVEVWSRKEGDKIIKEVVERHNGYSTSQRIVYYPKKYYRHEDSPIVTKCLFHTELLGAIVALQSRKQENQSDNDWKRER